MFEIWDKVYKKTNSKGKSGNFQLKFCSDNCQCFERSVENACIYARKFYNGSFKLINHTAVNIILELL